MLIACEIFLFITISTSSDVNGNRTHPRAQTCNNKSQEIFGDGQTRKSEIALQRKDSHRVVRKEFESRPLMLVHITKLKKFLSRTEISAKRFMTKIFKSNHSARARVRVRRSSRLEFDNRVNKMLCSVHLIDLMLAKRQFHCTDNRFVLSQSTTEEIKSCEKRMPRIGGASMSAENYYSTCSTDARAK